MSEIPSEQRSVIIIGAGPAGLSAAYRLAQARVPSVIVEKSPEHVGGISKTLRYKDCRFDLGGHRFFTKSKTVERFWEEVLGDQFLTRPRLSRIFYRGRFFKYPLSPFDVVRKLGLIETLRCMLSYLQVRISPPKKIETFEDWVVAQFGRRLFAIFFKAYTEKVWGKPCSQISADWAAQRIKGLSLPALIKQTLRRTFTRKHSKAIKTLIEEFRYPRLGPGQMWEAVAEKVTALDGQIKMGAEAVHLDWSRRPLKLTVKLATGGEETLDAEHVFSSMPLKALIDGLTPAPPAEVQAAAATLSYRSLLVVLLLLESGELFPDNWIYIHDPEVKAGRIQNFRNWSPDMVPQPGIASIGVEYFCDEGDDFWRRQDGELIEQAVRELVKLGLIKESQFREGLVSRVPDAYPVYGPDYKAQLNIIRGFISTNIPQLQLIGRNGMHRYNNQDHAVMTGFLAAENVIAGNLRYDTALVNEDAEYLEESR